GQRSNAVFSTWDSIARFRRARASRRRLPHSPRTSLRLAVTAALLIDFGSTWTKLRALDLDSGALLATAQGPSTVVSDVNVGLDIALAKLAQPLGGLPTFAHRLATSSAAGGLRMVTIGLVRELTAEAARQAALGAGAKLCGSFAYRLTAADLAEVEGLAPDIVLLCGG